MAKNLFISSVMFLLVIAGTVGVWKIVNQPNTHTGLSQLENPANKRAGEFLPDANWTTPSKQEGDNWLEPKVLATLEEINQLLQGRNYQAAVAELDLQYSALSSAQLERCRKLFFDHAGQLVNAGSRQDAEKLLRLFTDSNQDLDAFRFLGDIAFDLQHWQVAFDAYLNASALEYRTALLEYYLDLLFKTVSHLRHEKEKGNDTFGIVALFQKLHDQHPSEPRFQLELAKAKLRIKQKDEALRLLEPLRYDPDFGAIAEQLIANSQIGKTPTVAKTPEPTSRGEILVPLNRRGNSFFAKLSINGRQTNMLLDTGASITALSKSTISRLGLEETGRFIRLNTANGMRESQLYLAKNLRIGKLKVNELLIAEVDMESSSNIQGLLGTDLLNQVDPRYDYVIDNQRSALIFRRR